MARQILPGTQATDTPAPRKRRRKVATPEAPAAPTRAQAVTVTPMEANAAAHAFEKSQEGKPPPVTKPPVTKPPAPSPFARAPHQAKFPTPPELKNGFAEITTALFASGYDPAAEWAEISEALEIQGALTPGNLQQAANRQEKIADRAFRLYVVARREYAAYMRETDPLVGAIRDAAIAILEVEKRTMTEVADGKDRSGNPKVKMVPLRTKMITDADVAGAAAHHFPEDWADVNEKRDEAKGMLDQIENLSALARSRAYTASSMMSPGGKRVTG